MVKTLRDLGVQTGARTYFIADVSANHDGSLDRAKMLIRLAAEAGADAVKFQNFRAAQIVSDAGFRALGAQSAHQAHWKQSVSEVYEAASLPWEWTPALKAESDAAGVGFFSTPYDLEAVDMLAPVVPLLKVGSGDITWPEMLLKVAQIGKPVLLAAGASDVGDVQRAVHLVRAVNPRLVLMQCNTNYTGDLSNFAHIHLNVLKTFSVMFPDLVLGLSDHTPGSATALGAIALGARVIEKHFTDDTSREGPDHGFSMTPTTWREMVERSRELEQALGDADKRIAENERETVVVQRRCLRASRPIAAGTRLTRGMIDVLRPAPADAIMPYDLPRLLHCCTTADIAAGEYFRWDTVYFEAESAARP